MNDNSQFHPSGFRFSMPNLEVLFQVLVAGLVDRQNQHAFTFALVASPCTTHSQVLVLGGINDIGAGTPADKVFHGLKSIYSASHAHGAQVGKLQAGQ